jgi:hypothetical protein
LFDVRRLQIPFWKNERQNQLEVKKVRWIVGLGACPEGSLAPSR